MMKKKKRKNRVPTVSYLRIISFVLQFLALPAIEYPLTWMPSATSFLPPLLTPQASLKTLCKDPLPQKSSLTCFFLPFFLLSRKSSLVPLCILGAWHHHPPTIMAPVRSTVGCLVQLHSSCMRSPTSKMSSTII